MSVQGSASRKLFGLELPERVHELLRNVEGRAKQPLIEVRGEQADIAAVMGFFDDTGRPMLAFADKKGEPPLEAVAIELARLVLRNGRFEKNMPYAEMRHPANQRLCRRLYRVLEQEMTLSECESRAVAVRKWLRDRFTRAFVEPVSAGKSRASEPDP